MEDILCNNLTKQWHKREIPEWEPSYYLGSIWHKFEKELIYPKTIIFENRSGFLYFEKMA